MLTYHKTTGLKQIKSPSLPAAKVGTYQQMESWRADAREVPWQLRVKRRTKGSTWKRVPFDELPNVIKLEALLLGVTL